MDPPSVNTGASSSPGHDAHGNAALDLAADHPLHVCGALDLPDVDVDGALAPPAQLNSPRAALRARDLIIRTLHRTNRAIRLKLQEAAQRNRECVRHRETIAALQLQLRRAEAERDALRVRLAAALAPSQDAVTSETAPASAQGADEDAADAASMQDVELAGSASMEEEAGSVAGPAPCAEEDAFADLLRHRLEVCAAAGSAALVLPALDAALLSGAERGEFPFPLDAPAADAAAHVGAAADVQPASEPPPFALAPSIAAAPAEPPPIETTVRRADAENGPASMDVDAGLALDIPPPRQDALKIAALANVKSPDAVNCVDEQAQHSAPSTDKRARDGEAPTSPGGPPPKAQKIGAG